MPSKARYVYILSGQKFIKNAKNSQHWQFFKNLKLAGVTRQKIMENAKIGKFKCDILSDF